LLTVVLEKRLEVQGDEYIHWWRVSPEGEEEVVLVIRLELEGSHPSQPRVALDQGPAARP